MTKDTKMADIGEDVGEVEFEPFPEVIEIPDVPEVPEPVVVPDKEPVPA